MLLMRSTRYTFVCDPDHCDSLVELYTADGFGFPDNELRNYMRCLCGRMMQYIEKRTGVDDEGGV